MFRTAVLALTLGSASAFMAPQAAAKASTTLEARKKAAAFVPAAPSFADAIGAQPPLGLWDPLGLLEDADQDRFDRLRYVEVKHGRISMLAVLGHIVTSSGVRLPGDIDFYGTKFTDVKTGINGLVTVPFGGLVQILGFVGFLELCVMKDSANGAEPGEFPGDFRNGYIDFGWDTYSEETKAFKRGLELNNGRAAQMGILALMVHEQLDGNPYIINDLLGAPVAFN
jgi:hypothetical protein